MPKYIERTHDQRGMPTEYSNRVDLDTALKERGMGGFYGKSERKLEQKELHKFVTKRTLEVGQKQAAKELATGKMFNKDDMKKV